VRARLGDKYHDRFAEQKVSVEAGSTGDARRTTGIARGAVTVRRIEADPLSWMPLERSCA